MKNGLNQFDMNSETDFCDMCGAKNADSWQTCPTRAIVLNLRPRYGDIGQLWTLCDECDEGLKSLNRQSQQGRMGAKSS